MTDLNEQSGRDDQVPRAELAAIVDHTLLKTDATPDQVSALLDEAKALRAFSICVSPNMLPVQGDAGDVKIATVIGFPSGKHHSAIKAAEAARAVEDGADELDMVIDIGMLKAGRADLVQADVAAVRAAAPGALLKVIIESAALTDDEIVAACEASEAAGADYVKTSTGFSAAGGASTRAVALMRSTVGERLGVKASGGIRSTVDALAMVEAGASRLGLSGTAAVLDGLFA